MTVTTLVNIRRMVEVVSPDFDRPAYCKVSEAVLQEKLRRGTHVLEGVDGDEEANTVTYWYRFTVPGVDY